MNNSSHVFDTATGEDNSPETLDQLKMQKQFQRERSIGIRKIERFVSKKSKGKGSLEFRSRELLEQAILTLLLGDKPKENETIGDLRTHLRENILAPVQTALKELLEPKRGKPSNLRTFWSLLELPEQSNQEQSSPGQSNQVKLSPEQIQFSAFTEIVFLGTLNEMLVSVMTTQSDSGTDNEGFSADLDDSGNDEDNDAIDSKSALDSGTDWPWMPERQLYQRVWQSFLLNMIDWLSQGEVRIPTWLMDSGKANASGNGDFLDIDFESRLEKAFENALQAPVRPREHKRPSALAKARAISLSTATEDEQPPLDRVAKPFSEAAEEFSTALVNLVASVAREGDGNFPWFDRRTPPMPDGEVMWQNLRASWVPTPWLLDRINKISNTPEIYSVPVNAPLIVPPKKWEMGALHRGGYYLRRVGFYKFYLKNDRIRDFLQICRTPEISPVLDTVNRIQSTPFRINQRVWAVVATLLSRVDLLTKKGKRKEPPALGYDDYLKTKFAPKAFDAEQKERGGDRLRWRLTRNVVEELACRNENNDEGKSFYFAYNADTRGRLYPMAQWLSPQGEDLSKALLEFANGKTITAHGADYLAVHGSQQVRFEQILQDLGIEEERPLTRDERLAWIKKQEKNIRNFAANPLENLGWTKAKNPYSYLAFCFAWADYLDHGPQVISHLPVHVDGVCNGLQHIAALTGDPVLISATNLLPGPPQDIYLQVKKLVQSQIDKKASEDLYASFASAHSLIDRDMAKDVVMIIPYGAGDSGTIKAICESLQKRMFPKERGIVKPTQLGETFSQFLLENFAESMTKVVDENNRKINPLLIHLTKLAESIALAFSAQLTKKFPSIGKFKRELVSSAKAVICSGQPMLWQAPSGLPVIQRAFRTSKTIIDCRITSPTFGFVDLSAKKYVKFHNRIKFTGQRISNDVHERYQQSGILPNFIHSMDSTHLVKTIQLATVRGISDFTVIHDSFGVHAADLPVLSECIREAFISMYNGSAKMRTGSEPSPFTRFLQWCAVLSIAARAPSIPVEQFRDHIKLSETEKAIYNMVAGWAGRDSVIANQLACEATTLAEIVKIATQKKWEKEKGDAAKNGAEAIKKIDTQIEKEQAELRRAIDKLMIFASDRIDLEWPSQSALPDLSTCKDSLYFFA
ncbi:DNA-directed RNA polymerase [Propionivibrio dicarboxylicus]|uniref:DNA-directed RNA polymerase n=1 Tax=Propionivibrio dicarboxylicus TaxID=83767 RepID=A0A1G7YZR0_9RHOO|nr:DNA-directed RNA polymerase [Propionivibrio dicarboxylicus]SDH02022.1 DNA-dependent RNA polymerase [Propionivibrio dicarboxylicus]